MSIAVLSLHFVILPVLKCGDVLSADDDVCAFDPEVADSSAVNALLSPQLSRCAHTCMFI